MEVHINEVLPSFSPAAKMELHPESWIELLFLPDVLN
jgi:hypothetical protein